MQMTATEAKASAAGASSPAAQMWEQANWAHIEAEVKRLQMRIAKAAREGRWGKAQALQRLLTRSHGGKMLAVKRVTENSGKKTPGVDGRIWLTPAARWKGMLSLRHRGYRSMPLRRVYIPKSNGKRRTLHPAQASLQHQRVAAGHTTGSRQALPLLWTLAGCLQDSIDIQHRGDA
jgi:RNA-directed DNA polymerase